MLSDQKEITGWQDNNIDEPIHFVDIPPIKPATPLPDELMYGCMLSGWTYTALVAKKVGTVCAQSQVLGHSSRIRNSGLGYFRSADFSKIEAHTFHVQQLLQGGIGLGLGGEQFFPS